MTKTACRQPLADRLARWASDAGASAKSLAKLALQTRRATLGPTDRRGDRIIVMGNGPSLRQTIAEHADVLSRRSAPDVATMAVNFAARADEFAMLCPDYYILVDPHFFGSGDPNVADLWTRLGAVDWPMTLIVPVRYAAVAREHLQDSTVEVRTINAVGIEGWQWLTRAAYRHGRGMPRPRNVLIPAIMSALLMGYHDIDIVGADHSWMRTISVNERNEVVSVQPHFYRDDAREQTRVNSEYAGYPLHQIVHSFYIAFKAYHDIARYADAIGAAIHNCTPDSMIDAFPRRKMKNEK